MTDAPAQTAAPAPAAPVDLEAQMKQLLISEVGLKPTVASDDQVTNRIADSASHAINDVYGSVLSTLDELQERINNLRGRAAEANKAATEHIRNVVNLSADTIRAAETIKTALSRLDQALSLPK